MENYKETAVRFAEIIILTILILINLLYLKKI